ncbi:prolyl-tRNA synthetase associated domain-containing protein [Clostridium formicaceticum]|uniref:Aminoacyl-tRNA deacylase n=1 Tax=Clostridium formicaceticum TaxID=1497 RepID=A0AAC9RLK5_9CLOT|nr:prolyl-tRNA synthetase associated domain-containing protein [Clostridium formicaceticum]AOY74922.1 aminoacyl-tRNA deacylase [Clostridium formicaceticum]ARE89329.1 Prolyl-tRNA editing protein ProX [Clostridium formicaceticum]
METKESKVYAVLEALNIPYERYTHAPVATIAAIEALEMNLEVLHFKNLFLRNSKGDKHYLVLVDSSKKANTKALAKQIGSTRLSFASDERLEAHLGLEPGAVSPMGLINDKNKEVEVLIDQDLSLQEKVTLHPNINTVSITMRYKDLEKFLRWCGNKVQFVEIP